MTCMQLGQLLNNASSCRAKLAVTTAALNNDINSCARIDDCDALVRHIRSRQLLICHHMIHHTCMHAAGCVAVLLNHNSCHHMFRHAFTGIPGTKHLAFAWPKLDCDSLSHYCTSVAASLAAAQCTGTTSLSQTHIWCKTSCPRSSSNML
jgi:hypothetical protein